MRYGGNTSCVAIAHDGSDPTLLLDAGTGLTRVTGLLGHRPFKGAILLTHLHWDHTHGLPFFASGDQDDAVVRLFMPHQPGGSAEELLATTMSPPYFPIAPGGLRGHWSFDCLDEGDHDIAGFEVQSREILHKGGRTYGYRVSDGEHSVAYLPDHGPGSTGGRSRSGTHGEAALALANDADVLIHDAQYTAAEYPQRWAFGHSTVDYAVGLAEAAGVRRLVLFHHDPSRTDDELDRVAGSWASAEVDVTVAREGDSIGLSAGCSVVEPTDLGRPGRQSRA
jgi:phosphoribosyl 1,2-cyclic phosphodiesterase